MKVLLFEQFHGGHYFNYLDCIIPALRPLCSRLVVAMTATADAAPGSPRRTLPSALVDSIDWVTDVPPVSPALDLRARLASARHLDTLLRAHRPDYTLVPSADSVGLGFATPWPLGRRRWGSPAPLEPTFHYGYGGATLTARQRAKELVYAAIYRGHNSERINFVNFQYYEDFLRRFPRCRERVHLVGDPVPQPEPVGRAEARRRLGLPPDGRLIGMVGGLDPRKAVPELLAAFRAAGLPSTDRLLLAGRLAPAYAALVRGEYADLVAQGRLIVIDRFLDDAQLQYGFEALDVAAPVYYEFPGLASLALKALALQRPVLAHDLGWSAALVRRFGVGHLTDLHDRMAFAASIRRALDAAPSWRANAATQRLLAFHAPDNFARRMTEGVVAAQQAAARTALDWNWVLQGA